MLINPPDTAPIAAPLCLERNHADYYFSAGQIDEYGDDKFVRQGWFGRYLATAGADSLSCGEPREAYRVAWMPSSRNARVITLLPSERGWRLDSVDFGDALFGGMSDPPPATMRRSSKVLSLPELERLRGELTAAKFWQVPQYKISKETMDGTAMVIEGRSGNRYRAVTRDNLWDGTEEVACAFFRAAELTLPDYPRCHGDGVPLRPPQSSVR